ncbi:MAG TPA: riboflavin synthase [Nitrospirales bacterium]|nr:riboflavin synthase [Nitrospirales bacterium]
MFTGIIEEMGVVKTVTKGMSGTGLTILAKGVLEGLTIGDSMTVNGVCQTVVGFDPTQFTVDVSPETLKVTTLGMVKAGDPVNLERAMRLSDRLGGHLVSGHVDGVGTVRDRAQDANAIQMTIAAPHEILKLCVLKGSIAVDGISLTINEVTAQGFRVTLIPHTAKVTTLGVKQVGDPVNLETDLIGKFVERLLREREGLPRQDIKIDQDYLSRRGLI